MITLTVFMLETLKLSKTLKSSRDDFNVLDNFNVSSINASIGFFPIYIMKFSYGVNQHDTSHKTNSFPPSCNIFICFLFNKR